MMKKNSLLSMFLVLIICLILAACSDDKPNEEAEQTGAEQTETDSNNTDTSNENIQQESEDGTATEEKDQETSNDEYVEHQLGLKIGETGTVVSSPDKLKYEVTLNEVSYRDELENVPSHGNTFVVVDVTVKNVDDRTFDATDIFEPSLRAVASDEYKVPIGSEMIQGISDIQMIEGELTPSDTKTGNYVFRIEKADNYNFAFGIESDQITTRAEWEFSEGEVK
ncbi:DUF4352 domain-containing protein [Virgibacillus sp. M23]|uniref:DUF4352 domain-containing protein n=1 Tax=Virgibacillus sp. M23 TaxID=3079030 RepID=UPI002A913150|nr:DUF4352 domain-containing protein [Virgibacillus sp. M23]MDY7045174.1 DUF4352 domain-containing protein [Virgibacillus sp. M23]